MAAAVRPAEAEARRTPGQGLAAPPKAATRAERQGHGRVVFASGGWVFAGPARVEPVQSLRYALRAMTWHGVLGGRSLEGAFMDRLAPIRSIDPEIRDGRDLWLRRVVREGLR